LRQPLTVNALPAGDAHAEGGHHDDGGHYDDVPPVVGGGDGAGAPPLVSGCGGWMGDGRQGRGRRLFAILRTSKYCG
jgi:hypothetical protein